MKRLLFAALLVSLFVVFVPFEFSEAGSRLPQYLAALLPLALLGVSDHRTVLTALIKPPTALIVGGAVLLHAAVVQPVSPLFFVGLTGTIMSLAAITRISALHPRTFVRVIRLLAWLTVAAFGLQWLIFAIGGEIVDFHNMIFPTSMARISEDFLGYSRLTGWHIEPGTHSVSLVLMLITLRIMTGRFELLTYAGLLTVLGSFSTEGVVLTGAMVLWILADHVKPPPYAPASRRGRSAEVLAVIAGLGVMIAVAFAIGVPKYLETRFSADRQDGSQEYKQAALNAITDRSLGEQMTGFGFDAYVCDCSMDGLGFGLNLLGRGGLLLAFALLIYLIVALRKGVMLRNLLVVLAVLMVSRFSVSIPLAWIPLFLLTQHVVPRLPVATPVRRRRRRRSRHAPSGGGVGGTAGGTAGPAGGELPGAAAAALRVNAGSGG